MAVPDFQSMMLPFLQYAADGKEHDLGGVSMAIVNKFKLSREDIDELLPSGNQTRLFNRLGWCRTHLKNANLIEYVRRGVFRITARGQELLAKKPTALNLKALDEYPEHKAWFHQKKSTTEPDLVPSSSRATPEEQMEALAKDLKQKLAVELLEYVKTMDPFRFQRLVLDLLLAMGYGGSREEAAMETQKSNDEGVDGLINEDRLGLDRIYIQAKRWTKGSVGRPDIQGFVGALAGKHAQKGVFITTSEFAQPAIDFARSISQRVILIDGQRLADLMIEHNLGVSRANYYELKRVDNDYFEEG